MWALGSTERQNTSHFWITTMKGILTRPQVDVKQAYGMYQPFDARVDSLLHQAMIPHVQSMPVPGNTRL